MKRLISTLTILIACVFTYSVCNAIELEYKVDFGDTSNRIIPAMIKMSDREMESVIGQAGVGFTLGDGGENNMFEIKVDLGKTTLSDEDGEGPGSGTTGAYFIITGADGDLSGTVAQFVATVPNNAQVNMDLGISPSEGLDLGGSKAFEIPPNTSYLKANIPNMQLNLYVSDYMRFVIDSRTDGKSMNSGTIGTLKLFGIKLDIGFPKGGNLYIYPS